MSRTEQHTPPRRTGFVEQLTLAEFAERFLAKAEGADPWKDDYTKDARVPRLVKALRGITKAEGQVGLLGAGSFGTAAALSDKLVAKLTTDASEVQAGAVLVPQKLQHVVKVHASYFSKDVFVRVAVAWDAFKEEHIYSNERAGILLMERVTPIDSSQRTQLSRLVNEFKQDHQLYPAQLMALPAKEQRNRLRWASEELERQLRNERGDRKIFDGVAEALRELRAVGVFAIDVHGGNVGLDGLGVVKIFDIGSSSPPMKPKAKVFGAGEGLVPEGFTAPVWDDASETSAAESARLSRMSTLKGRWGLLTGDPRNPMNVNGLTLGRWLTAAGYDSSDIVNTSENLIRGWQEGQDPSDWRASRGLREGAGEGAADYISTDDAFAAARKQGATHYSPPTSGVGLDGAVFYAPVDKGDDYYGPNVKFTAAKLYNNESRWHLTGWAPLRSSIDLPVDAQPLSKRAREEQSVKTAVLEGNEKAPVIYEGNDYTTKVNGWLEKNGISTAWRDFIWDVPPWSDKKNRKHHDTLLMHDVDLPGYRSSTEMKVKVVDFVKYAKKHAPPKMELYGFEGASEPHNWDGHTWVVFINPKRGDTHGPTVKHEMRFDKKTTRADMAWVNAEAAKKYKVSVSRILSIPAYASMKASGEVASEARDAGPYATMQRDVSEQQAGKALGAIKEPRDLYNMLEALRHEAQEVFVVVPVSVHGEPLCRPVEVARGQRDRVSVDHSDVLRPVITTNAVGFYVAHCHPSGHASPSQADLDLTASIKKSTKKALPNVVFIDHLVVTADEFYSIEAGELFQADDLRSVARKALKK